MQLTTLVLATLSSLAAAQKTWVVAVALNGSLTYSPNKLSPQPGEFVQFQFHGGNHTATQSTFAQPCQPVGMHSNMTGFHSGFMPAAASAAQGMLPTYTIQINDTNPLWVYCAQSTHCEKGMVMVINEPTNPSRSLEAYKAAAAKANTVVPGMDMGGMTGSTGSTGSTTGSTSGGSSTSGTAGTPSQSQTTAGAGSLAAPATIALVAAAGAALFL